MSVWNWGTICEAVVGRSACSVEILFAELVKLGFTNLPDLGHATTQEKVSGQLADRRREDVALAVTGDAGASMEQVLARIETAKTKR